jgi:hypothetical protein
LYRRCTQAVPVLDRRGKPTGEFRMEAPTAAKCLELLGKHQGMFGALSPAPGATGELAALFAAVRASGRPGLPGERAGDRARVVESESAAASSG